MLFIVSLPFATISILLIMSLGLFSLRETVVPEEQVPLILNVIFFMKLSFGKNGLYNSRLIGAAVSKKWHRRFGL